VKQKVFYYNDSDKAIGVSVETLYQENTIILKPLQLGEFEVELEEGEAILVKRWNRSVLIGRVDKNGTKNLQGIRPSSQAKIPTSMDNK